MKRHKPIYTLPNTILPFLKAFPTGFIFLLYTTRLHLIATAKA